MAAAQTLRALLERDPRHAAAHMTLGHIAWSRGRVRESAHHVLQVAANPPSDPRAVVAVAMALLRAGETAVAHDCLGSPVLSDSGDAEGLMLHASLLRQLGEDAKALAVLDRAHALGVDGAEFRFMRGLESLICGRLAEGEADLETSLRMDPCAAAAALELARMRKRTCESNHLADFNARLRRVPHGTQDHAVLEFARYKELEDLGDYVGAWDSLRRANEVMRALHRWDPQEMQRRVDALTCLCTEEFVRLKGADHQGPQPIFIIGLPRSGTTLLDRLLGGHSQVTSAGELDDFALQLCWAADQPDLLDTAMLSRLGELDYAEIGRRYLMQTQWRAPRARFFVDKQPWNHVVAGLIARALPRARLLHVVRDPMDVCFSNFRAMLGARYAYSFDLEALGQHYLQYERLHAHWRKVMPDRVLDVAYRDLVHDRESALRRVLEFCGLDWEPGCVDVSRNPTAVGTLSAVQVRAPIHARAFGEWRPYESQLSGLARVVVPGGEIFQDD